MNTSDTKKILHWQIYGFLFIVVFGSLLHFFFEWSGKSTLIGLFSPVNESVWEHLKLGFWSLIVFSLIEFRFVRGRVNNYFAAKAAGIIALELFIVIFFYSYTAILGDNRLVLDIMSYVLGVLLCQIIAYKILTTGVMKKWINRAGLCFLLALAVVFMIFTFHPPKHHMFRDSNTGQYGIMRDVGR